MTPFHPLCSRSATSSTTRRGCRRPRFAPFTPSPVKTPSTRAPGCWCARIRRAGLVERFGRALRAAYRLDASCRGDPQMMADLLKAVVHPVAGRSAARAIHDIYGAEALPAIVAERKQRAGDRDAVARLDRLADELAH